MGIKKKISVADRIYEDSEGIDIQIKIYILGYHVRA